MLRYSSWNTHPRVRNDTYPQTDSHNVKSFNPWGKCPLGRWNMIPDQRVKRITADVISRWRKIFAATLIHDTTRHRQAERIPLNPRIHARLVVRTARLSVFLRERARAHTRTLMNEAQGGSERRSVGQISQDPVGWDGEGGLKVESCEINAHPVSSPSQTDRHSGHTLFFSTLIALNTRHYLSCAVFTRL